MIKKNYFTFINKLLLIAFIAAFSAGTAFSQKSDNMLTKSVPEGKTLTLTLKAGDFARVGNIKWYKNGVEIAGENGREFVRENALPFDAGIYYCTIETPCGELKSNEMQVIINRTEMTSTPLAKGSESTVAGMNNDNGKFTLLNNEPNPVTERTTIKFETTEQANIKLRIADGLGNVIATLVDGELKPGSHEVPFVPANYNLASGLYYYILEANGFIDSKPMIISR